MAKQGSGPDDPKGLIHEAYLMDGITTTECRTIFLDWALSLPGDVAEAIPRLLAGRPGHPMTDVLREAMAAPARAERRGGRAARRLG